MNFYDYYWPLWLTVGFLVVELSAAFRKDTPHTLSGETWRWFDIFDHKKGTGWRRAALVVFLEVLTAHLAAGLPAWPWLILSAVPVAYVIATSTIGEIVVATRR